MLDCICSIVYVDMAEFSDESTFQLEISPRKNESSQYDETDS